MKYIFRISVIVLLHVLFQSCKKEFVPALTTSEITNITGTTAMSGGTITDEGSGPVTERGVCWSTNNTPTVTDNKTIYDFTDGSFICSLEGLDACTIYYVRAFATNSTGTGYGSESVFTTLGQIPLVSVVPATKIYATDATLNGVVNANSLSTVVTFAYGIYPNYDAEIKLAQNPLNGEINTNVSVYINGLVPDKTYQYRIKAENSLGTTYSAMITFHTKGLPPTISLQPLTGLTSTGVTINAVQNLNYLSTTVTFEFGLTETYGNTASLSETSISGYVFEHAVLTGLLPEMKYYFRFSAVNLLGTAYCIGSFTTLK